MRTHQYNLSSGLLALVLLLFPLQANAGEASELLPALVNPASKVLARAGGGVGLYNTLNIAVIAQGTSKVNGILIRGPRLLIAARKAGYDANAAVGRPQPVRLIVIIDAKQPNRILFRGVVPFAGQDVFYRIVPNPQPRPMQRVLLVPIRRPMQQGAIR